MENLDEKILRIAIWLDDQCTEAVPLDDKNKDIFFLPVGQGEKLLDSFDSWGTSDFIWETSKVGNGWVVNGSINLNVEYAGIKRTVVGAKTMAINFKDTNNDWLGSLVSLCLMNAAKKLGKRFGRELNNRMSKGETALPVVQVKSDEDNTDISDYLEAIKEMPYSEAKLYLDRVFKYWKHDVKLSAAMKEKDWKLGPVGPAGITYKDVLPPKTK